MYQSEAQVSIEGDVRHSEEASSPRDNAVGREYSVEPCDLRDEAKLKIAITIVHT